jgi:enoyl-CoA hydratase/carnithine racemase
VLDSSAPAVVCIDGPVCRLRLNRPDKLNALDAATQSELQCCLNELAERPEIAVLVLSGEGRAFSAGFDVSEAAASISRDRDVTWTRRRHAMGAWQRLLEQLEAIPQVTVASIHGHCVGGGALLAIACDIRVGADDLRVRIPELAIGFPLTWAGVPRLTREVGLPLARDLVMTGRVLDAPAALATRFVQRLVPRHELAERTDELVGELIAMPAGPLAITRSVFSAIGRERLGAVAWADADILGWCSTEPDTLTAGISYLGRRSAARGATPPAPTGR